MHFTRFMIAGIIVAGITNADPCRDVYRTLEEHPRTSWNLPLAIDAQLRITAPLYGKQVRGQVWIRGKAKANSSVLIKVTGTYYELGKDLRKRKMFKGKGPIQTATRKVIVKTDGQGVWKTNTIDFRNHGWSEEFKIVATSVEGKNSTYIIVKDETKPIIEWD